MKIHKKLVRSDWAKEQSIDKSLNFMICNEFKGNNFEAHLLREYSDEIPNQYF